MTLQELATYAAVALAVSCWLAWRILRRVERFARKHRGLIGFVTGFSVGRVQRQRGRAPARPPLPAPPNVPRPTALYRHYDTNWRLLYVGITDCARGGKRWLEHEADKPWFGDVEHSEISTPYPTRGAALYAEAVAIRDERPVYNIQRPDPRAIGRRAS